MTRAGGLVPVYRRRPSALHAAAAGTGAAYCAAIAAPAVLFEHPLVLAACLAGLGVAGAGAHVGRELRRSARVAVPLGLAFAALNPLVANGGATLLVRGEVVLGHPLDVTLEELAYGGVAGLRLVVVFLAFTLASAAVDPDELLRLARRVAPRSALTAALATRLVPVLVRDASRRAEGARCRPSPPPRLAAARATLAGALDRAAEIAAALEVRGYGGAARPRPPRPARRRSRHDHRVAASAALLAALALALDLAGAAGFAPYPRIAAALGPPEAALAAAIVVLAALPFAGAAARLGVARG